jgi:hypothetical protein
MLASARRPRMGHDRAREPRPLDTAWPSAFAELVVVQGCRYDEPQGGFRVPPGDRVEVGGPVAGRPADDGSVLAAARARPRPDPA